VRRPSSPSGGSENRAVYVVCEERLMVDDINSKFLSLDYNIGWSCQQLDKSVSSYWTCHWTLTTSRVYVYL